MSRYWQSSIVAFAAAVEGEQGEGGGGDVVPALAAVLPDVPAAVLLLGSGEEGEAAIDRRSRSLASRRVSP